MPAASSTSTIAWFSDIGIDDIDQVGGKNASLGESIGSNDLTQLTLGLDRDSSLVAATFDERDPAVKSLISQAIGACKARGMYVGICGQGPSDHPDLAEWLLEQGIDSMALNPDTVVDTWIKLGRGARE